MNNLDEQISKKMGWWSPDGFDAYPEKTAKIKHLLADYSKYLGTLSCNKVDEIRSYQELEKKGIVQITPIITENAVMIFAKKGSKLKAFNRIAKKEIKV